MCVLSCSLATCFHQRKSGHEGVMCLDLTGCVRGKCIEDVTAEWTCLLTVWACVEEVGFTHIIRFECRAFIGTNCFSLLSK